MSSHHITIRPYSVAGDSCVEGPLARVYDRPMRGVEEVAEGAVAGRAVRRIEVAAVELHVVDAPRGERLRVDLHVELGAGVSGARVRPDVLVDAELEAERVNLKT